MARVLLLGPAGKLLLLLAEEVVGEHQWWVTPGGGLNVGESFEQAARRAFESAYPGGYVEVCYYARHGPRQ